MCDWTPQEFVPWISSRRARALVRVARRGTKVQRKNGRAMSRTALDYSRWDSLEEPSDDEDTGACIGMPGRDGGPGTVYRWDELRTELPWQQQAPDDEPASHARTLPKQAEAATLPAGGAGASLKHEEPATAPAVPRMPPPAAPPAPPPAVSAAPAATAAPLAGPPPAAAQADRRPAQHEGPSRAAEAAEKAGSVEAAGSVGATEASSAAPLSIREDRLLNPVMALNDLANQHRCDGDRRKRHPPPVFTFFESRCPVEKQPRYACQCSWIGLEVQCEPLPKKQDSKKQQAALRMIYELRRKGVVDILPFVPDEP